MSARIYDADIYAFDRQPERYWSSGKHASALLSRRLDGDIDTGVAIIGGGYAGLSAARQLYARHGTSVAVIEAGEAIGWGASGANAGFVSMGGSKLSLGEMLRRVGPAETSRYWATQIQAVEELRAFASTQGVDCQIVGDGNYCVAHHEGAARALARQAEVLSQQFAVAADFVSAKQFRRDVHDGPETFGALRLRPGFALQPQRLVEALANSAAEAGVQIYTGAEVVSWDRLARKHQLITATGARVTAKRVILATNGYTPNGLADCVDYRSLPAISSILVSQPYSAAELDARGFRTTTPIYNSRSLLSYYRRLPDGRLLFGGRGDTRGSIGAGAKQAEELLTTLKRLLPAFRDAEIAFAWRGLIGLTARKTLAIGLCSDDPTVAFAYGCHGSGTATMPWAGRLAADLLAGAATDSDVPAVFRGAAPRLPRSGMALRWGLKAAYGFYGLRDAMR